MQQVTEAQTKQQKESADERFLAGLMLEHKDLSDEQLLSALDRAKDLRISADREAEWDAQVEAAAARASWTAWGKPPSTPDSPGWQIFKVCWFTVWFIYLIGFWCWCATTH